MASETCQTTLKSRSYIGLLAAQFLACFNDQAIHYVAMFYGADMLVRYAGVRHLDVKAIVTIVPACFLAPFLLFSPLAGVLADKYSKRNIIVFWKIAEVGIMGLVLGGFLLPHLASIGWAPHAMLRPLAEWSSVLLIGAVFLMATHSTFFIPAKYGIMPEILHPSILSRGNGLLEGTSFTGNILGTVFGGLIYVKFRSHIDPLTGALNLGREWILGAILLGLALVGAVGALMMPRIPAADPELPMSWSPWVPLRANFGLLRRSPPLILATIGIAFFTFVTLFFRQTLVFDGQALRDFEEMTQAFAAATPPPDSTTTAAAAASHTSPEEDPLEHVLSGDVMSDDPLSDSEAEENKLWGPLPEESAPPAPRVSAPRNPAVHPPPPIEKETNEELRIALLIAFIGLGVGVGCTLAGMISGDRIELGLVLFGGALIVLLTVALALVLALPAPLKWATRAALVGVGIGAGLYIVPLYTLLQHRAPKESKGNLVALSSFLNVAGGLIALGVFYFITFAFQSVLGLKLTASDVKQNPQFLHEYVLQLQKQTQIPSFLFLCSALITVLLLYRLCRLRPDFLLRTISWFRLAGRRRLHTVGLGHVPSNGRIILATNCQQTSQWIYVMSAIDRGMRLLRPVEEGERHRPTIRCWNRWPGDWECWCRPTTRPWSIRRPIGSGCLPAGRGRSTPAIWWRCRWKEGMGTLGPKRCCGSCRPAGGEILPVHCGIGPPGPHGAAGKMTVAIGPPLHPTADAEEIREAIRALAFLQSDTRGC